MSNWSQNLGPNCSSRHLTFLFTWSLICFLWFRTGLPPCAPLLVPTSSVHWRAPVKSEPEAVLNLLHTDQRWFIDILQENYPPFFTEAPEEDKVAVTEYLSDADLLSAADWRNEMQQDLSLLVAMHGIQYSNTSKPPKVFQQFFASSTTQAEKARVVNETTLQDLHRITQRQHYANLGIATTASLATDYLPFLKLINRGANPPIRLLPCAYFLGLVLALLTLVLVQADELEKACKYSGPQVSGTIRGYKEAINAQDDIARLQSGESRRAAMSSLPPPPPPRPSDYFDEIVD